MGDPICKWRNASIWTIKELVSQLPHVQMPQKDFRLKMESSIYGKAFTRTVYQLACQLALYYEDEKDYYPRFDHDLTDIEASDYLHKWIKCYYVPNPYTVKGFIHMNNPINLFYGLCDYLSENEDKPNLVTACAALFGEETGNLSCIKFVLNNYSNAISVDKNLDMHWIIVTNGNYEVANSRYDKKSFFETFN